MFLESHKNILITHLTPEIFMASLSVVSFRSPRSPLRFDKFPERFCVASYELLFNGSDGAGQGFRRLHISH